MIITRDTDLHRALSHLEWVLKCRNYPAKMIQEQFSKALSLTQKDILSKPPEKEESSRDLVFSIPYSTNHSDITKMLKQQWREIERDPELTRIWDKPPTVATMRHQNLKDAIQNRQELAKLRDVELKIILRYLKNLKKTEKSLWHESSNTLQVLTIFL